MGVFTNEKRRILRLRIRLSGRVNAGPGFSQAHQKEGWACGTCL
jgi:hypothetical protein